MDDYRSIEVYFTGRPKHCYLLRQVILQALHSSSEILAYDEEKTEFTAATYCRRKHVTRAAETTPHPITVSFRENPPEVRCSMETDLPSLELSDERQKCWLIGKCI